MQCVKCSLKSLVYLYGVAVVSEVASVEGGFTTSEPDTLTRKHQGG